MDRSSIPLYSPQERLTAATKLYFLHRSKFDVSCLLLTPDFLSRPLTFLGRYPRANRLAFPHYTGAKNLLIVLMAASLRSCGETHGHAEQQECNTDNKTA